MDLSFQNFPFAWVPVLFPALWLGVGALLSWFGGWPRLARRFPGGERPEGAVLRNQVSQIGLVSEHGVTGLVVARQGLYLWSHFLFRFQRPPILVPWAEVRYHGREEGRWWWKTHMLRLGGATNLRVGPRAFETIRPFLMNVASAPAPASTASGPASAGRSSTGC